MAGKVNQVRLEVAKKCFDIDVYPDGFWVTSRQGAPAFINIKYHNLVEWDNEQLHKQMAEEVLMKLAKLLRLDREYKEKPSEVWGHSVGTNDSWYIEVAGYYKPPNWGALAFFKCPSKKLPYIDIKYRLGSPETPAMCRLSINKEELQRLSKEELVLIDDKDRRLKVILPYYIDEENDILIMPAKINVILNIVCYKGKCGEIKYSGVSIVDRRNKVFTAITDADVFKPIIVQY